METYTDELQSQNWFQRIMKSEGGVNDREAASVGGKSCAGIGKDPYDDWLKKKCQIADAPTEVKDLLGTAIGTKWEKASPLEIPKEFGVRVDVIVAFYKDYLYMARLECLPDCLQYMHADFFVNAKFNANRILQRMVGFKDKDGDVDGILGPASRERLKQMKEAVESSDDPTADDDLIIAYHEQKLAHYESIKETAPDFYEENIRGWRKRAQHVLSELEDYFHDEEPTTSAIHEDDVHISLFDDPELPELEVAEDTPVSRAEFNELKEMLSQVLESVGADAKKG